MSQKIDRNCIFARLQKCYKKSFLSYSIFNLRYQATAWALTSDSLNIITRMFLCCQLIFATFPNFFRRNFCSPLRRSCALPPCKPVHSITPILESQLFFAGILGLFRIFFLSLQKKFFDHNRLCFVYIYGTMKAFLYCFEEKLCAD